jgi:two-component system response regulator DevR
MCVGKPMDESVRVLIVDDSSIVCDRLVNMLADLKGVSVIGLTGSIAEARQLIAEFKPDVITLDLHLTDGSGLEVLREVKNSLPAVLVIVLTNYTGPLFREMCEQANADLFFDKALEFERVREVLQKLAGVA